jgi:hypothetical protein
VAENFHDSILEADVGALLQQQLARLRGDKKNATSAVQKGEKEEEDKASPFAWWGGVWDFVTRRGDSSKEQVELEQPPPLSQKGKEEAKAEARRRKKEQEEAERLERQRRKEQEEEERAASRESRREKAAEGIKSTARAITEGWQSVDWGGVASRVKGSGKDAWTALRSRIGGRNAVPDEQQRDEAALPPAKPQAPPRGFASWPSMGTGGGAGGKPFLPSLLQRIDPSAYTSSVWNSMMGRGTGAGQGPGPTRAPGSVDGPRSFDDLVKLPQTAGEAWDLFVDDTRSFFDAVYRTVAVPRAALPKQGPQRPVLGAQRPKAARVRQGPLNAAPLVLRERGQQQKQQQPEKQQQQQQQQEEQGHDRRKGEQRTAAEERRRRAAAAERERAERMRGSVGEEEGEEEDEEKRWEAIRGRVQDMLQGQQQQQAAAQEVAGLLGPGAARADEEEGKGSSSSGGGRSRGPYRWLAKLPKPLKAPRLVDRLEERPRGIATGAGAAAVDDAMATTREFQFAAEDVVAPPPPLSPSLPPPAAPFPAPFRVVEREEGEGKEGRWKRPAWLDNLSLTKVLTRKPSPEKLKEIIKRRQAVRRMPRRMDDNFLRTVSRKLGGNRLRIREFQLATDRYRNSLLDAPDYYDEVVALFGSAKDAEEVLLPLMSLLPEASKRRGLLEEYRGRQRRQQLAAAGLAADVREGAGALGGVVSGWLAGAGQAVGGLAAAGARAVGGAARAVVSGVQQGSAMIELSWETEDYARRQQIKDALVAGRPTPTATPPPPPPPAASGAIDSGTAAALLGLEAELSRNRYLDAPLQRIAALLSSNADYFSLRLDLYRRGGITGDDGRAALRRETTQLSPPTHPPKTQNTSNNTTPLPSAPPSPTHPPTHPPHPNHSTHPHKPQHTHKPKNKASTCTRACAACAAGAPRGRRGWTRWWRS